MTIQQLPDLREQGPGTGDGEYVVIVFNNDYNTYDEVMDILMKATACTAEEAAMETWEVDHLGKSTVHHSGQDECERVASVIRTIGIKVEVRQE
jgi:ATP-dependent Clp protease adaptor protein ClpS